MKSMEVRDYMRLPYTRLIQEMDDEGGHYYFGKILELDGCHSTGDTLEELNENLDEALEGYLEVKLEHHLPIPLPEREHRERTAVPSSLSYVGAPAV